MEEVPVLDFPFLVTWLRVGRLQLHLCHSGAHHFGLDVDDFEVVEANWPDASMLDRSVAGEVQKIGANPGEEENIRIYKR